MGARDFFITVKKEHFMTLLKKSATGHGTFQAAVQHLNQLPQFKQNAPMSARKRMDFSLKDAAKKSTASASTEKGFSSSVLKGRSSMLRKDIAMIEKTWNVAKT